jgi:hypothetical protein
VWLLAIVTEVGNGKNTLFWTDRWLLGQSFEQTLPHLFSSVAARARKKTVHASLSDGSWIAGIRGLYRSCSNTSICGNFFQLFNYSPKWRTHISGNFSFWSIFHKISI